MLKVVVSYKNKSEFEMSHLVVLVNPENAKDNFYVEPLKISQSLKAGGSVTQTFVFQEYDPGNVNLSCHVGYQLQRYRRRMVINLPRSANKFMEEQFVSSEALEEAFEGELRGRILQSDEFSGSVEKAKDVLRWVVELGPRGSLRQAGGKVELWCQGRQHAYLVRVQQNRAGRMVVQLIEDGAEAARLTKLVESVVSALVFMIQ